MRSIGEWVGIVWSASFRDVLLEVGRLLWVDLFVNGTHTHIHVDRYVSILAVWALPDLPSLVECCCPQEERRDSSTGALGENV